MKYKIDFGGGMYKTWTKSKLYRHYKIAYVEEYKIPFDFVGWFEDMKKQAIIKEVKSI